VLAAVALAQTDEEEEEEPRPRKAAAKKAAARPRKATSKRLPPRHPCRGQGAEEINKGGASNRITLTKDPQLIKCLENAPFVSFASTGPPCPVGAGDRPYTCIEEDCRCALSATVRPRRICSTLALYRGRSPEVKILQVAVRAYNAFKDTATPKGKENPVFY